MYGISSHSTPFIGKRRITSNICWDENFGSILSQKSDSQVEKQTSIFVCPHLFFGCPGCEDA